MAVNEEGVGMGALVQPALFFGPAQWPQVPKEAITPELWVQRMDSMKTRHAWSDKRTAEIAWSWMRGRALHYFNDAIIGCITEDKLTSLKESWVALKAYVEAEFFVIRDSNDMSQVMAQVRYTKKDTHLEAYAHRVLQHYNSMLTRNTGPQEVVHVPQAFMEGINATLSASQRDNLQQQREVDARKNCAIVLQHAAHKMVIATLINQLPAKHSERINVLWRKEHSMLEILRYLQEAQRHMDQTSVASRAVNRQNVSAMNSQEEMAAMKADAKKIKKKKATTTGPSNGKKKFTGKCHNCGQFGHIKRFCKMAVSAIGHGGAASDAEEGAFSDAASTVGADY